LPPKPGDEDVQRRGVARLDGVDRRAAGGLLVLDVAGAEVGGAPRFSTIGRGVQVAMRPFSNVGPKLDFGAATGCRRAS